MCWRPEAVKTLKRKNSLLYSSELTAQNARGARVPPWWSGRSCARFLLEGTNRDLSQLPFVEGQFSQSAVGNL
jgi:hypothetical protein